MFFWPADGGKACYEAPLRMFLPEAFNEIESTSIDMLLATSKFPLPDYSNDVLALY